jgi:hypothetical protein
MAKAATANPAAPKGVVSTTLSPSLPHGADQTKWLALDRWENEGGRIIGQEDVAAARSPVKNE